MLTVNQPRDEGGGVMSLGSLFKDRRAQLGLTQKQVAEEADIGLSYYKQIETDRANPTFDKVERLVRVLDVEPRAAFKEINPEAWADEEHDTREEIRVTVAPEVQRLVDAVRMVQNIFSAKRTSRRLPGAILDAEEKLMEADLDELDQAAEFMGFTFIDFNEPREEIAEREDDREVEDMICEEIAGRMLVAAMYGDAVENADIETLVNIANVIRDTVYSRRSFIQNRGFFEDKDKYPERVRAELLPHLIEAAKQRKAPDLDNLFNDVDEEEAE